MTTPSARLAGSVALVTGAARGIGQALAVRLAQEGAAIAAVDLTDSADTVRLVEGSGGTAVSFTADISDPDAVSGLHREVAERLGPPTSW
jgi:3-oxoacyl-[acyl-carrier protein] reductase